MEKRAVFISYHTNSSLKIVEKIVNALEKESISCWYAPRDCSEQYAGAIVSAIRECKVFLLVLNKESNVSEHVLNEINYAFERYKNHENITLLPFRIDECELSDDVYYYLGRIHMMNGVLPPIELRISELVDRIKNKLRCETITYSNQSLSDDLKSRASRIPIVSTVVYPDSKFIGRQAELNDIKTAFETDGNVVFLVGMGGIGKSEIAKKYAKIHSGEYNAVVWMNFEQSLCHTLADDNALMIKNMNRSEYPEDDENKWFHRKVRLLKEWSDKNVLIVIDNFDIDDDPDLEWFCNGAYDVLFTTRIHQSAKNYKEIDINAIDNQDELMSIFLNEYQREASTETMNDIREIILFVNKHTLTIRLIASVMNSRRLKARDMLELLKGDQVDLKQHSRKSIDIIQERLEQIFNISSLSDAEQEILMLMSLIPLQGIAVEELYNFAERDDFETIDDLVRKNWVIHNPITDMVHLHPLISKICEKRMYENSSSCTILIKNLMNACDQKNTKSEPWQRVQQLHNYLYHVWTKMPESDSCYRTLMDAAASAYMDDRHFATSLELFEKMLLGESDDIKKPYLYHRISQVQLAMGDAEAGAKTALEGYHFMSKLRFEDLPINVKYMKKVLLQRLGEAYRRLSEFELAIKYGKLAVSICDECDFVDPELSKGWAVCELAHTFYFFGKTVEAMSMNEIAAQLFSSIKDEWSLSFCNMLKCRIEIINGEFDAAQHSLDKVWRFREVHCGVNSVEHADYLKLLADISYNQGEIIKALQIYKNAAQIYNCHHRYKDEEIIRHSICCIENAEPH